MGALRKEKLQPYRIEIAKDGSTANSLKLEFETCIYTPAMVNSHRDPGIFRLFFFFVTCSRLDLLKVSCSGQSFASV